jgi:hypothetical protein
MYYIHHGRPATKRSCNLLLLLYKYLLAYVWFALVVTKIDVDSFIPLQSRIPNKL